MQGFVRSLGLAVSAISLVIMLRLLQSNGIDMGAFLILLVSIGLAMTGRVPIPLLLILAGVAGVLIY